jgi:hypothetical protein
VTAKHKVGLGFSFAIEDIAGTEVCKLNRLGGAVKLLLIS